ncbi:MAG: hypothetical protein Q7U56_06445 [Humidesulfovibrio sp.]|nr:hypothetical protein [Humidesulfovibrio sp.]
MGGGGGFNPIPIITTLIFGPAVGGLVGTALAAGESPRQAADSGAAQAAQAAEAERSAEEAARAAEERRRTDRRRQETALLDQARAARRADLVGQNAQAQTLGAPAVETSQLKEKLGQ